MAVVLGSCAASPKRSAAWPGYVVFFDLRFANEAMLTVSATLAHAEPWSAPARGLSATAALQATPLLRNLKGDRHVGLACAATLLSAAKAGKTSDSEAALFNELDSAKSAASEDALLLLATAQWHLGELQTALLTLDELSASGPSQDVLTAAKAGTGWVMVEQRRVAKEFSSDHEASDDDADADDEDADLSETYEAFDEALAIDGADVEVRPFAKCI
jgi:hypothetical protein